MMTITGVRSGPVTTIGALTTLVSIESILSETLSSGRAGYFYRGDLLADRYTLATLWNPQGLTVDLGPGQIIDDIVLPLHDESAALLQGLITYLGEPLADCFVNFGGDSARTGADGRFTVHADQPDSSWFRASVSMDRDGIAFSRNLIAQAGTAAAQQRPIQLDFAQGSAVVEGAVFRNGEPWTQCNLLLDLVWDDGLEESIRIYTNSEGAYRFEGLPPGTHDVRLNIAGRAAARGGPTVRIEAAAGQVNTQDIEAFVGSAVISVAGMLDSENAALRVIPGEIVIDSISKEIIGQLGSQAVVHRTLRGNAEVRLPDLSSGTYTVFVDSYEAPARGIDAALETMRFTSAFFEVVQDMETEVSVVIE